MRNCWSRDGVRCRLRVCERSCELGGNCEAAFVRRATDRVTLRRLQQCRSLSRDEREHPSGPRSGVLALLGSRAHDWLLCWRSTGKCIAPIIASAKVISLSTAWSGSTCTAKQSADRYRTNWGDSCANSHRIRLSHFSVRSISKCDVSVPRRALCRVERIVGAIRHHQLALPAHAGEQTHHQ